MEIYDGKVRLIHNTSYTGGGAGAGVGTADSPNENLGGLSPRRFDAQLISLAQHKIGFTQNIPPRDLSKIRRVTKYKNLITTISRHSNSCHQKATKRVPHGVKILFEINCGVSNFRSHVFSPTRTKTHLKSALKQDRLSNFLLLLCHKSVADTSNTADIAKKFCLYKRTRKRQ